MTHIFPERDRISIVVGSPITVPLIPDPSEEEVEKYHALYCSSIHKLFENNKRKYGKGNIALKII